CSDPDADVSVMDRDVLKGGDIESAEEERAWIKWPNRRSKIRVLLLSTHDQKERRSNNHEHNTNCQPQEG
ncbi:MAG: hypothetical protein ACOYOS_16800, partial [Syntrophales bacterium]